MSRILTVARLEQAQFKIVRSSLLDTPQDEAAQEHGCYTDDEQKEVGTEEFDRRHGQVFANLFCCVCSIMSFLRK